MTGYKRVQGKRRRLVVNDELTPKVPFGKDFVSGIGLHPTGKALIEPQPFPPSHRDEISEPLVCKFMRDHGAHALFLHWQKESETFWT